METTPSDAFARIVRLAQSVFDDLEYSEDYTTARAILRLQAVYGRYRILVVELFGDDVRKYRYFVLQGDSVEAGFDNDPDPRAIRIKYGKIGAQHSGELVPHLHRENKSQLVLTQEMTFEKFVEWLKANLNE